LKRKAFYKKQNYKIVGSDTSNYNTNFDSWPTIFNPKNAINKDDSTNTTNNLEKDEEGNHCFFKPMVLPKK
jgi:hypothetical protein